jgi:hypothetical protein
MAFIFLFRGIRTWPGNRDDIYACFFDLAFGMAYISAGYGLYRRDYRARILAIILSGLGLAGSLTANAVLGPTILNLSVLGLALFVFIWLLLPSVRAQFLEAREHAKTA